MTRDDAIELVRFEAFEKEGIVELVAGGTVCEFERFSKLIDAIEELAKLDQKKSLLERRVVEAVFVANSQLAASIASWTPEQYEEHYYFAQLTQDLQYAVEKYLAPEHASYN